MRKNNLTGMIPSLWGFLFIGFAIVQLNDPDPLVWISIYSFAALICFYSGIKRIHSFILLLFTSLFASGCIYLWPSIYEGIVMPMEHSSNIELARESLGLLICAIAMMNLIFLNYIFMRRLKMAKKRVH
ncbi:transmembrane 220 family protein [Sporocytophaga myxococcoides]|uniref:transmembrane 220 family protein n=1 Tax=Sporocytophaga myxococcoides TaxID=153721 RepID=UPI00040695B7|nr:transmembrane 220 family protein [Sporocytophaga myxococcoides]